jgi:hypothetical protein
MLDIGAGKADAMLRFHDFQRNKIADRDAGVIGGAE